MWIMLARQRALDTIPVAHNMPQLSIDTYRALTDDDNLRQVNRMFSNSREDILQLIHNRNELLHPLVLRTGATVEGGMMKVHGGLPGHCKLYCTYRSCRCSAARRPGIWPTSLTGSTHASGTAQKRIVGQECGTSAGLRPVRPATTLEEDARPSESAYVRILHKVDKTLRACRENAFEPRTQELLMLLDAKMRGISVQGPWPSESHKPHAIYQ